jgi:hypothetical protein
MQNIVTFLCNDMIIDAVALFPMTLFLTALRLEKITLHARMDMLQISFFLFLCMFQECKILADPGRQAPEAGSVNGRATLLMEEALIRHLNTLLAIIWLLRDASDITLGCLSTRPVRKFLWPAQEDHP